jgi:DNA-binding MarR family transcriptional regulator
MDPALLKRSAPRAPSRGRALERASEGEQIGGDGAGAPTFDLIELFFFAYRDFVGDADRLLEAYKFGRAHHRVLHFVNRHPGLTIAELLDILRITKQSLNRVLKELLDQSYVESRPGVSDRRQRLLFPTPEGRRLALEVARLQSERFSRVLGALGEGARADAVAFLLEMIDPGERDKAASLVWPEAKGDA